MGTAAASEATRGIAGTLSAMVAAEGSAAAAHAAALADGTAPTRDLSDAVHALCTVHGAFPGLVDHALRGADDRATRAWLATVAEQAAAERALLAS